MRIHQLDPKILQRLPEASVEERKFYCEQEPAYFGIYYFPKQYKYQIPDFHFDMDDDYAALMDGDIWAFLWLMFRDSAKTTKIKIQNVHSICYSKKRFIRWITEDGDNAEQALFDITRALQTNPRIISDFGNLYNEPFDPTKKSKKTVKNFITTNGVKMEALSIRQTARGAVYGDEESVRPDWLIFDDFETTKTVASRAETSHIIGIMDESIGGLAANGVASFLGNYISETGSVQHFINKLSGDPKARIRNVPVVDDRGVLAWPDKFVKTDTERDELNARIEDQTEWKVSLESKKRQLTNYEADMMNNPTNAADLFFSPERIKRQLEYAITLEPVDTISRMRVFRRFIPGHAYGVGGDAGTGSGSDHSAATLGDYSTIPVEIIGTFKDNRTDATELGFVMMDVGKKYGECLLAPEKNYPGNETVSLLVQKEYVNIYTPFDVNRLTPVLKKDYGFQTDKNTRRAGFSTFRKDFNDGKILILDPELLREMRTFTWADLWNWKDEGTESEVTKHYDLLMSAVIWYAIRNRAERSATAQEEFMAAEEEYAMTGAGISSPE